MSAKTQRIQGEYLDKRKLSPDNVDSLNVITENNTSNISATMTQNIEVFIKTNFIKKNGDTEDYILPEQSEPDIKLEPCVIKTDCPTMDSIDIGPVKIEPQENDAETMVKMHNEESSWSKYFSEFATNLPEEHAKRIFLIEFLQAYRASPGLWDINSEDFHDPKKKEVQYANLLTKYREYYPDGDRKEMQKKINGYRSYYNLELRKIDYLNNGNIGSDKKYVSNLWYFDLFSSMCGNKESLDPINKVIPSASRESFTERRRLMAKRQREALKKDPIKLACYREKAKERARKYRERLMSDNKECVLEKHRIKQRRYRDRKKNETQIEENLEPYACKQTLGKALAKAERALPNDLDKKIKVINILYEKYGNSTN
ncbi:uncharacterized protein LOC115763307 isoform X2 [Drosophila novamexicana]|uniref:uncharacterized protein LOC115763307 isoform X2 n=1 Tax=Drosophila novamexicana TaxID=47314 RepID=UPI0011E59DE9|nr:uncharacterized protein LOC115763307 isoform X2 [Drosophila novamexicana]